MGSSPKSPSVSLTQIHLLLASSVLNGKVEILQDNEKYRLQNKDAATLKRCAGKRELVNCPPSLHGQQCFKALIHEQCFPRQWCAPYHKSTGHAKPRLQHNCVEIVATKCRIVQSTFHRVPSNLYVSCSTTLLCLYLASALRSNLWF